MPCFNQVRFIERSLLSVLNQGYPDVELIVMDGGSTDGTLEVLRRYAADIAVLESGPDGGQSDALNRGFARATGALFGWLNSDDLYLPGAFAHAARLFDEHPGASVVYGDWLTIDTEDAVLERYLALACSRQRLVTEGFFCNAQAMFWRRALHRRFGRFDERLHYTMDYDFMLRLTGLAMPQEFLRTARALGCFRIYPGQKSGPFDARMAAEHRVIAERSGVTWKFSRAGRALRLLHRATRVLEYLQRGGPGFVLQKLRS